MQAPGEQRWKFKTNGVVHSSPALAFGNVYVGSWDTYLYALKASDGAEVWKFKTGIDTAIYNQTGIQGSPMISDSILYFGCRDSHVYALNALTGAKRWQKFNDYSWAMTTPVICKDKLIYGTADGHSLVGLDKITGDSIYGVPAKGYIHSSPSLVDDKVYFGDLNGFITCSDAQTGRTVWRYQLDASRLDKYKILACRQHLGFYGRIFT
ncbi:MAG: PQQ-binding-like beta-propeller repeat protein [Bacteroidota bacterium]